MHAARSREVYPLLTTLPSSILLWWRVFSAQFCDVVFVLLCDHTNLLKWLLWRSNGFALNSASNSARWLRNHNRKCGISLTLKAWCIRNVFHQDKWWMENSIAMFWGNLGHKIWHKHPAKWHYNSWAMHHDNTPAHTSLTVRQFSASTEMTVILHPPYLQDLATCNFFLFLKMKLKLKAQRYDSTEQIQTKSQNVMKKMMKMQNDFQKCFLSWKSQWNCCIIAEGDYFEGNGGEQKFR